MSRNLSLRLPNSEQSLAVVRAALLGFAEVLALDALATDELETAVLEACKNVVWHAYDGTEGPLELELHALEDAVEALVRDRGIGIRPHLGERREHHTGIGLSLIHVRAHRVTYTNVPSGGTELRIEFDFPGVRALEPPEAREAGDLPALGAQDDQRSWLALSPPALAAAALPRVLRALWRAAALPAGGSEALAPFSEALVQAAGAGGLALSVHGVEGSLVIRPLGIDESAQRQLRDWAEADSGELELRLQARE
jgi:serine/threonine-protein kinase RsbW